MKYLDKIAHLKGDIIDWNVRILSTFNKRLAVFFRSRWVQLFTWKQHLIPVQDKTPGSLNKTHLDLFGFLFYPLTPSTPGKIFNRRHNEIFFLFFPENKIWHFIQIISRKQAWTFHSNCLYWRQFARNVKFYCLVKIRYYQFVFCWINPERDK